MQLRNNTQTIKKLLQPDVRGYMKSFYLWKTVCRFLKKLRTVPSHSWEYIQRKL